MAAVEKKREDMTVGEKIRDDWGTQKHFCKKHGFNPNTFQQVLLGHATSAPKTNLLIRYGYIKSASELKKKTVTK